MASGIIGSIVGQIASQLVTQALGSIIEQFGMNMVSGAMSNLFGDMLGGKLKDIIDQMPLPQFMKDAAKGAVDEAIGDSKVDVDCMCQDQVNETVGGTVEDIADTLIKNVLQQLQDEQGAEEAGSAGGKGAKGGKYGGGSGNWLVVLARALGQQSGEHLKNMVELGQKMGSIDSKENPEEFAETQAEFQAESQIFKMFQESISTMIKSIGEGMASVARKQ